MADENCGNKGTVNLTEVKKSVSEFGEREVRESQSPSKPAHYSRPESVTVPPPATGQTGNTGGSSSDKK
jgi:hypothetical protein